MVTAKKCKGEAKLRGRAEWFAQLLSDCSEGLGSEGLGSGKERLMGTQVGSLMG